MIGSWIDLVRFLITSLTYFVYLSFPILSSFLIVSITPTSAQSLLSIVTNSEKSSRNGFPILLQRRKDYSLGQCFLGSSTGLVVLDILWVIRILTSQELFLELKYDSGQLGTREHPSPMKQWGNFCSTYRIAE